MSGADYRSPTLADAEAMAEVHVRSMCEAYAAILPAEVLAKLSVAEWTERWRSFIAEAKHPLLLAVVDGEAAGIIRTGSCSEALEPKPEGHIFQLYVRQAYHRQGIGRALMRSVASDWRARGAKAMSVGVLTENSAARTFYEELGGRRALQSSFSWDGHVVGETIYVFDELGKM